MTLALEARAKADDILVGDTPKAKNRRNRLSDLTPAGRLWKHSTLRDIDGIVDASQMDDYFVFTIVRNPWDRMVSYYHWAQTQTFDHPVIAAACAYEFAVFFFDASNGLATHSCRLLSKLCPRTEWAKLL